MMRVALVATLVFAFANEVGADAGAAILVSVEPSAFETESGRQRVRLLREAFGRWREPGRGLLFSLSIDCADPTSPRSRLGVVELDCSHSAIDEMSRLAADEFPSGRPPIMVVVHGGERPDVSYDAIYDRAIFLDVALAAGELVLGACRINAAEHTTCRLGQELEPFLHPDDDALALSEHGDELHFHQLGPGRPPRELRREPVGSFSPFVVQRSMSESEFEPPSIEWGAASRASFLRIEFGDEASRWIRDGFAEVRAIHSGADPAALRLWTMRLPGAGEPAYSVLWPHGPLGTHIVGIELVSRETSEPLLEATIPWTNLGTVRAGEFLQCGQDLSWEPARGLSNHLDGDVRCDYAPWWSSRPRKFRLWPNTTGRLVVDPSHRVFPWFVWLVAWFGLWLALRGPRPTSVGQRMGDRESYRDAPVTAWVIQRIGKARSESDLRIIRTPLGPLVLAKRAVWVRSRQDLFRRRRFFFAQPEQLVVADETQLIFLGADTPPDERTLAALLASKADIREAPDEESIAATAATRAGVNAFIRLFVGSIGLAGAALFGVANAGPALTQRNAFVAAVLGLVLVVLLCVRLATRRRRRAPAAALLLLAILQSLLPPAAHAYEDAREMAVFDWNDALAYSGHEPTFTGASFTIETVPSALNDRVHRQRVQLFHQALAQVFAPLGRVRVSPSTECARLRDPSGLASCSEIALAPTDYPGEAIRIVVHAGGEIPTHSPGDIVVDVAALRSSQLALRACELSSRVSPVTCHLSDAPRLEHPLDRALIVEAGDDSVHHASFREFGGEPTGLFRNSAEDEAFVVYSEVEWKSFVGLGPAMLDIAGESTAAHIDWPVDMLTWYLLRREALRPRIIVDGVEGTSPPMVGEPTAVLRIVPERRTRGEVEARLELVAATSDEVVASETEHWTSLGEVRAGAFYECADEWERRPIGLETVQYDDERCAYLPWWSRSSASVHLAPRRIGFAGPDPAYHGFLVLLCVFAWGGGVFLFRRRQDAETREILKELSRTSSARLHRLGHYLLAGVLAVCLALSCAALVVTYGGAWLSQRGPFVSFVTALVVSCLILLEGIRRQVARSRSAR